jgi:hypothetical protein
VIFFAIFDIVQFNYLTTSGNFISLIFIFFSPFWQEAVYFDGEKHETELVKLQTEVIKLKNETKTTKDVSPLAT